MDLQVVAKLCWPKQWSTNRIAISCPSKAQNFWTSMSEKVREQLEQYFPGRKLLALA